MKKSTMDWTVLLLIMKYMAIVERYDLIKEQEHKLKTREKFLAVVITLLVLTFFFALVSGFYSIDSSFSRVKKSIDSTLSENNTGIARLIASIVFPMSAVFTFILVHSLTLREKLRPFKATHPFQFTAYTRMSQISTATVVLCAITGLLSIYASKLTSNILLISCLFLLSLVFILLIFNALYFYYTYTKAELQ